MRLFATSAGLILAGLLVGWAAFMLDDGRAAAVSTGIALVSLAAGTYFGYRNLPKPSRPVTKIRFRAPTTEMGVVDLLDWRNRLVPELVGRDEQKRELLEWAKSDEATNVLFLGGPGGADKTRLAAETALILEKHGWQVGFAKPDAAELLPKANLKKLLLLLDYPEENRKRAKALLDALADVSEDATSADAEAAAKKAVEICRRLARTDPEEHEVSLALSLGTLQPEDDRRPCTRTQLRPRRQCRSSNDGPRLILRWWGTCRWPPAAQNAWSER